MIFKLDVLFYNILYVKILILYKNIVKQKVEQTKSEYYWSMGGRRAGEWNRTQKIAGFWYQLIELYQLETNYSTKN